MLKYMLTKIQSKCRALLYRIGMLIRFIKAVRRAEKGLAPMPDEVLFRGGVLQHSNHALELAHNTIAMSVGFWGMRFIYVDDEFFSLPENVQAFIYEHERGHIEMGHLDSEGAETMKERRAKLKKGSVSQNELEADAYAAWALGKDEALAALRFMESHMWERTADRMIAKELGIRIEHLDSLPL